MTMAMLLGTVKRLFGARDQVVAAVRELDDLPAAFDNLKGIFSSITTIKDELTAALIDGYVSPIEANRIIGRLGDLTASGTSVVKEVEEAVTAIRPLIKIATG
jgi:hypothetical protein